MLKSPNDDGGRDAQLAGEPWYVTESQAGQPTLEVLRNEGSTREPVGLLLKFRNRVVTLRRSAIPCLDNLRSRPHTWEQHGPFSRNRVLVRPASRLDLRCA